MQQGAADRGEDAMRRRWMEMMLIGAAVMMSLPAFAQSTQHTTTNAQAIQKSSKSQKSKKAQKTDPAKGGDKTAKFIELVAKYLEAEREKQYGAALAYCKDALAMAPDDLDRDLRVSTQMACAFLYGRNKAYDEQLALLESIDAQDAQNVQKDVKDSLCLMKATAMTQLQRYAQAQTQLESCAADGVVAAAVAGNLAELYMTQGDIKKSLESYEHAVQIAPKNQHALYGRTAALVRAGQWQAAREQFLKGVERDPGFAYLNEAFFVPEAEGDFQVGLLHLMVSRWNDAEFYLQRYVEKEERAPFRAQGQKILDQLRDYKRQTEIVTLPVPLEHVKAMAIDASGRYVAFGVVERKSANSVVARIWLLDRETSRTRKLFEENNVFLTDMVFVGDTTQLRILGATERYAVDVAETPQSFYTFRNNASALPLALMPGGDEIVTVTPDNRLAIAPWQEFEMQTPIDAIPGDARRATVMIGHERIAYSRLDRMDLNRTGTGQTVASLPMQFDIERVVSHPSQKMFALGIQSGSLLLDENGSILALVGSPEHAQVSLVSFDPHGKWLASLSGTTLEIRRMYEILHPWLPVVGGI